MKTKGLLCMLMVVLVGCVAVKKEVKIETKKKDTYSYIDHIPKDDINTETYAMLCKENVSLACLKEHADAIVLATIDTIDHADMKHSYYGTTYGTFRVLKTLYGKIDQGKQLPYNKEGGIIKYEDWNSVQDVKLDSSYRYIRSCFDIDILLEVGKTYLMYVKYDEELHSYTIIGYGEGVREVKGTDVNDVSSLQIKNNLTHVYESLEDYCIELEKS